MTFMRLPFSALLLLPLFALLAAVPAVADVVDSTTDRQLFLRGAKFSIAIPRDDWVITKEQMRSDGKSVYYALASIRHDITLWAFIDQTPVCQDAKTCLGYALKNDAYKSVTDMKFSEHEGFSVVQFTLEPAKDGTMYQHLIAATYVDGAWVDIHLTQQVKPAKLPDALLSYLKLISIKRVES